MFWSGIYFSWMAISLLGLGAQAPKLKGTWKFEQIWYGDSIVLGTQADPCGKADQFVWTSGTAIDTFSFAQHRFVGQRVGVSGEYVWMFDPETFSPKWTNNSCPTYWWCLASDPNKLIRLDGSGLAIYHLTIPDSTSLDLTLERSLVVYVGEFPRRILLKRS
ncbi:MAG: hypothetical protein AAGH79_15110 [Bacteroidota bacterium]